MAARTFQWRFVITNLSLRVLTFLDVLARDKKITYTGNKAAVATGVVPSDNPEINLVQGDGFPILEEGVRCLFGLRREDGVTPWVTRYAGLILGVEDNVDENGGVAPYTTFTAYDPRQLLYKRPIRTFGGDLPGPAGLTFTATPGNEIALTLLARTLAADGETYILDDSSSETTDAMTITFQQGISVGEAWDLLNASGNLDIVLTAMYDPAQPGKLATVSCYSLAGSVKHKAIMAWDKPSRSLVGLNRLKDGTQRANRIQFYAGQGGSGGIAGEESDGASQALYGDYWAQQFFPGNNLAATELLAAEELLVKKNGVKTYKVNPVAGSLGQIDSPLLFFDYFVFDQIPIYASTRFREEEDILQRVYEVPVVIRDDGTETIEQLSFSADGIGG